MSDDPRSGQEHAQASPATSHSPAAKGRTEPAPAGPPPGGDASGTPASPRRKRPWALVALCALLAIAVVGLAVWGAGQKSDADDAQAKVEAQQQAAASATVSDDTKAAFQQVAAEVGANGDSLDAIQQQIDAAKARVDAAEQQRNEASGAIDTAKAELESFKAKADQARTCLQGSLDALGAAVDAGGVDAAVQELQQIAGSCRSAAAPE
jgi:predicted negative regulator of RcsB-dependent stress response